MSPVHLRPKRKCAEDSFIHGRQFVPGDTWDWTEMGAFQHRAEVDCKEILLYFGLGAALSSIILLWKVCVRCGKR